MLVYCPISPVSRRSCSSVGARDITELKPAEFDGAAGASTKMIFKNNFSRIKGAEFFLFSENLRNKAVGRCACGT